MALKRKESLRQSFARKLKERLTKKIWLPNSTLRRKKPLKKISRSQRRKLREYQTVRDAFLLMHSNCEICEARRNHGENILLNSSSEVHHRAGRGANLCNVATFVASCFRCRMWPHENPKLAREWGLLL